MSIKKIKNPPLESFIIKKSPVSKEISDFVQIMPDIAVCNECIKDIDGNSNRRLFYPFTNCTQCGPRYSIIHNLPYDRPNTTMKEFTMCSNCLKEYKNPTDRRFHAQPNACPVCGPQLMLTAIHKPFTALNKKNDKNTIFNVQQLLKRGKIVAIKGIGGFLLACDAANDNAVKRLRIRKNRPKKPLAIMCKDIATIKKYCYINREEAQILQSRISPIVLLKKKPPLSGISSFIATQNGYFGVMLPYTPLHMLLFNTNVSRETLNEAKSKKPKAKIVPKILVMTSANPKNAPIISDANLIRKNLGDVAGYILDHNRSIKSRCDDSIVFDFKGPVIIRRSRGYVPEPIFLKNISLKPVLAFGSDYKNHFALGQGNKVYLSPYIGDLTSSDSVDFLFEMLEKYRRWFGIKPKIVACDLHPDYISKRLAEEYARKNNLQLIKVQHHYAHLAGVVAEHGLRPPVIGISFDGTGYGTDNTIWGSEIMVLDYKEYERMSRLKELPLTGGDIETTNPKQIATAYLNDLGITKSRNSFIQKPQLITRTTSMGRLFDAVASILGVCHKQTFEGEAPIALQNEAMKAANSNLKLKIQNSKFIVDGLIDPKSILQEIVRLKDSGTAISDIASVFHKRIVDTTVCIVKNLAKEKKIKTVCISGGVFQNKIILDGVFSGLANCGLSVYINRSVPINDGGISFGQVVLVGIK